MPQLDFNFYLSQTTWLFFIFIIFHIYLKNYIYPYIYEYFYLTNKSLEQLDQKIAYFL